MPLKVGDKAPAFKLPNQDGNEISSDELISQGPLVVFFYPKDETSGCTAQACGFRDSYQAFQSAGANVVGVSSDSVESHQRFRAKGGFQYHLLSDQGGALRKQWGVPKAALGMLPGRVTYVLDKEGTVQHVFNSMMGATQHVTEALGVVQKLAGTEAPAP